MDKRALIAGLLSLIVIIIFHYLYLYLYPPSHRKAVNITPVAKQALKQSKTPSKLPKEEHAETSWLKKFKSYFILTSDYSANLTSSGARFVSFKLRKYFYDKERTTPIEMITAPEEGLPLEVYLKSNPRIAILKFTGPGSTYFNLEKEKTKPLQFELNTKKLLIKKTLIFKKDSYFIDGKIVIKNMSEKPVKDSLLFRGVFGPFAKESRYAFKGPYYYTNHLNEVKLKDTLSEYVGPLKYLGYQDTYFIVALIPQRKDIKNYRATFRKIDKFTDEFILWTPEFTLKPGETYEFPFKLYMGPKRTEDMKKEYPLLAKALYFGIFDFIAKPLLYLLKFSHRFTHNFGWDIVIITVLLRILFFPLNQLSYKSMSKLKELQPVIENLRKKYKDDPQKLQQEIMRIYRTHKANPFSGCLPILIQIPVFIAFYKMLLMAIELRHAPFMLWITDLSAPERLYIGHFHIPILGGIPVLTILMGLTMYIQQKLTPTTPDPFQEKLMLFMPIFFTIIFINFPSGLVLYWFVNNILSIVQQYFTLKFSKN